MTEKQQTLKKYLESDIEIIKADRLQVFQQIDRNEEESDYIIEGIKANSVGMCAWCKVKPVWRDVRFGSTPYCCRDHSRQAIGMGWRLDNWGYDQRNQERLDQAAAEDAERKQLNYLEQLQTPLEKHKDMLNKRRRSRIDELGELIKKMKENPNYSAQELGSTMGLGGGRLSKKRKQSKKRKNYKKRKNSKKRTRKISKK